MSDGKLILDSWIECKRRLLAGLSPASAQSSHSALRRIAEEFMEDIKEKQGIEDYSVICDASNNPPSSDENELNIDIMIKPIDALNYIVIDVNVLQDIIHHDKDEPPDESEDLSSQLEAWINSRGGDLHRAGITVRQSLPLGGRWQPHNGDREVPSLARDAS